jgi:hypothetical protein
MPRQGVYPGTEGSIKGLYKNRGLKMPPLQGLCVMRATRRVAPTVEHGASFCEVYTGILSSSE